MKQTKLFSYSSVKPLSIALGCALGISSLTSSAFTPSLNPNATPNEATQRYIVRLQPEAVNQVLANQPQLDSVTAKHRLFEQIATQVNSEVILPLNSVNGMALMLTESQKKLLSEQSDILDIEIDPVRHLMAESTPYGITMVEAPQVSDASASNRKVCIMDTGYTLNHPDLPSSGVTGDDRAGSNSTGNWYNDGNGHGTHVAGTIAAIGGNGQGVVGVNPSGTLGLHIVKVFKDDGNWGYGSNLVIAVEQCAAAGSNVISMSLGGGGSSSAEQSAFNSANAQGILSIAAAGNSGNSSMSYPASYNSVVSVAAVDSSGNKASFSQYNSQVEIAAPGVGVNSTWNNGGYNSISGTSMATPHVSGVAALIWSHYPSCSNQKVRDAMNQSAEDRGSPGRDTSYGHGIVKAKAALTKLAQLCGGGNIAPTADFSTQVSGKTATFTDASSDDKGVVSHNWNFGDGSTSPQKSPSHTYSNDGTYQVTLTVADAEGLTDSKSASVTIGGTPPDDCDGLEAWSATKSYRNGDVVSHKGRKYTATWWSTGADPEIFSNVWRDDGKCSSTGENEPPKASFTYSANQLNVSFSDTSTDDNGVVSRSWNFGDGNSSSSANPSHSYAAAGSYTVSLTVTDAEGLQDTSSQTVTVSNGGQNEAPVASFSVSTNRLTASFTNSSTDDNGIVAYNWTFGDGRSSSAQNPSHTYTSAGTYSVTLTVTDAEGLSDSTNQSITVSESQGCVGLSEWNASTMYQTGDEVSFKGNKYRATWWSRGASPDIFSNVWSNQGPCS
ncbi:MAG: PKD domain-containing protein [Kangiellaceae bacterium]|nr:PKD domain-containing protein [Kangiellaceae bacterium]